MFEDGCILMNRDECLYLHNISKVYSKMLSHNEKSDICKEWLNDFYSFYTWAWTNYYKIGDVLVKKQPLVQFNPQNCEFVSVSKMMSMRRRSHKERQDNVYLTYNGEKKTVTEWSKVINVPRTTLYDRVKRGWSVNEVLCGKTRALKRTPKRRVNGNDKTES